MHAPLGIRSAQSDRAAKGAPIEIARRQQLRIKVLFRNPAPSPSTIAVSAIIPAATPSNRIVASPAGIVTSRSSEISA
jgi:hypothetical protein